MTLVNGANHFAGQLLKVKQATEKSLLLKMIASTIKACMKMKPTRLKQPKLQQTMMTVI